MKKETVKKEEKETKKIVKKTEKKSKENKVIFNKDVKKTVKYAAYILSFCAAAAALFTFIFGIITTLKVANNSKVELLHDNFSVTFISNINGQSITDVTDNIMEFGDKTLFIILNIVIPCIAIIACMILLIIAIKMILDFVSKISRENELYTNARLVEVEKIACLIETIITITFLVFNRPSFFLFILVSLMFFIIIGLFKKCVDEKNNA